MMKITEKNMKSLLQDLLTATMDLNEEDTVELDDYINAGDYASISEVRSSDMSSAEHLIVETRDGRRFQITITDIS